MLLGRYRYRKLPTNFSDEAKRKIYKTRSDAGAEIFNHIELFYNPNRRRGNNNGISPVEFEKAVL
jgi:putative transposase